MFLKKKREKEEEKKELPETINQSSNFFLRGMVLLPFEIKEPIDEYVIKFYNVVIDHILRQIFSARCQPNSVLNLEFGYGGLKLFQNEFLTEEIAKRLRFLYLLIKKHEIRVNMFCESGGNIIGLVNWMLFSVWESCAQCEKKRKEKEGTPLFLTFCPLEETNVEFLNKKYERVSDFLWRGVCSTCVEAFLILKTAHDYFVTSVYSDLFSNCVREKIGNVGGGGGKLLKVFLTLIFDNERNNIFPFFSRRWCSKGLIKQQAQRRPRRRQRGGGGGWLRRPRGRSRVLFKIDIQNVQKYFFPSYLKTLLKCKNSFQLLFFKLQNSLDELLRNNNNNYETFYRETGGRDERNVAVLGSFSLISVLYSKSLRKCIFVEMKSPFNMDDFLNEDCKILKTINRAIDFTGWFNPLKDIVDIPVFFGRGFNFDNAEIIEKLKTGDNFSFSYSIDSASLFESVRASIIGIVSMQ